MLTLACGGQLLHWTSRSAKRLGRMLASHMSESPGLQHLKEDSSSQLLGEDNAATAKIEKDSDICVGGIKRSRGAGQEP